MQCPFLEASKKSKISYCRGDDRLFVPSLFELTVYCSSEPDDCPLFRMKESFAPKKDMQTGQVMEHADTALGAQDLSTKQQRS